MTPVSRAAYPPGDKVRIGSMFSGVGGLDLAVEALFPGSEMAWLCENDDRASAVLAERFPGVPNHGDVTTTDWTAVEPVDVVCGGFPCQDISHAGKRAGIKEGTRSGLWFDMLRAVRDLRPQLLLLENVAAITAAGGGLDAVLGSLAEVGWDAEWACLRASDVGAPHGRDRWFAVCWPHGVLDARYRPRGTQHGVEHDVATSRPRQPSEEPADADLSGLEGRDTGSVRERAGQRPAREGGASPDVNLLPTPNAGGFNDGEEPESWLARRERVKETAKNGNGMGMPLGIAVKMLPTPTVTQGRNATSGRQPDAEFNSGTTLQDVAYASRWGEYGDAVARWEAILGRPAPAPTDDEGRLSPDFVEWMMGWPAGWTDVPRASRTQRLKQCGNGVVPQQAYAAYTHLLDRLNLWKTEADDAA